MLRISVTTAVLLGLMCLALGQPVPFLSEEEYDWLSNEISGDAAYEHIRYFSHFHRAVGTPGLMEVAKYVERKAREYGLKEVRLIKQDSTRLGWECRYGEIWLTSPHVRLLASTRQVRLHLADYSRTTHLEEIIKFFPDQTEARAILVSLYVEQGEKESALVVAKPLCDHYREVADEEA